MQLVKKLFKFYIDSNLHVGIAGASFTAVSLLYLGDKGIALTPIFVFFSTVLGYHFIRIFENYDVTNESLGAFLKKQSNLTLGILFLALLGVLCIGLEIGIAHLWILSPAVAITFFYAIPILIYKGQKVTLRTYPKLKLVSIAIAWTLVTVVFPLQGFFVDLSIWILFIQRFLLIMVLVIPFDIRDMQRDAVSLQTLPQQIGITNTKKLGLLFLLFFMSFSFFRFPREEMYILLDLILFVVSLAFLYKSNLKQSTYFASFWVEAIPIFWVFLTWMFAYFIFIF